MIIERLLGIELNTDMGWYLAVALIRFKKHGCPEFMLLGDLLHGVAKDLRHVPLLPFGTLRVARAALEKQSHGGG